MKIEMSHVLALLVGAALFGGGMYAKQNKIETVADVTEFFQGEVSVPEERLPPERSKVVTLDGHNRTEDPALMSYCENLARSAQRLQHGDLRVAGFGARYENVADAGSWEQAYQLWRASSGHAKNIERGGPYIGYANRGNYYVVIYGEKLK